MGVGFALLVPLLRATSDGDFDTAWIWFDATRVSSLARLTSQGVIDAMGVPAHLLRQVVNAFVTPITVIIVMFAFDWRLAWAAAITAPLAWFVYQWSAGLVQNTDHRADDANADAANRIVEFAQTQAVLRGFAYENHTVLDQISFTAQAQERTMTAIVGPSGAGMTTILRLIARFGDADSGTVSIAGGERQPVSIARAFLKDAPIVLLDEATAALDPINERAVQQALQALTQNNTLVVVAYRLQAVQAAEQDLVLDQGRIVERGKHSTLLEQEGRYASFWKERVRAAGWRVGKQEPKQTINNIAAD